MAFDGSGDLDEWKWDQVKAFLTDRAEEAVDATLSPQTKLVTLYKCLNDLWSQAEYYIRNEELERAYMQLFKYATVRISIVTKHADYGRLHRKEKLMTQNRCEFVVKSMESISIKLKAKWDAPRPKLAEMEPVMPKPSNESKKEPRSTAGSESSGVPAAASEFLTEVSSTFSEDFASSQDHDDIKATPLPPENLPSAPSFDDVATPSLALSHQPETFVSYPSIGDVPSGFQFQNRAEKALIKPMETAHDLMKKLNTLRTIYVPADAPWEFLRYVESNTKRDKESCGILTGRLVNDELYITHIILPRQSGTSNTVEALDEDKLIEIQIKHDLLTLDLHTQYSYQCMMPEALAIVMAPSYADNCGYFSLTGKGMAALKKCQLRNFHSDCQTGGNIYGRAMHVVIASNRKCQFIDIR